MSTMQNYLTSRSPCGDQGCTDKPRAKDIRHKGRVLDKQELHTVILDEVTLPSLEPVFFEYDPHIYEGERCIFCNVNTYDDSIYGPFGCVPRERLTYTTETPRA